MANDHSPKDRTRQKIRGHLVQFIHFTSGITKVREVKCLEKMYILNKGYNLEENRTSDSEFYFYLFTLLCELCLQVLFLFS